MKKYQQYILFSVLFILSFLMSYWLYMEVFFFYSVSVFHELYSYLHGEYWVPLTMIFLITYFLSTFLYQLILKEFSKKWIKLFYALYSVMMIYFLFFKSIGVRGIELNPFAFLTDILHGDSFIVFLNILIFIPIGWILKLNKKNILIVLSGILLIETLQLIFALGFFDLSDISTNFIGYLIGTFFIENSFIKKNIIQRIK